MSLPCIDNERLASGLINCFPFFISIANNITARSFSQVHLYQSFILVFLRYFTEIYLFYIRTDFVFPPLQIPQKVNQIGNGKQSCHIVYLNFIWLDDMIDSSKRQFALIVLLGNPTHDIYFGFELPCL